MTVSMVFRCHQTETHPITFDEIWSATRTGKHGLKEKINLIRNRYEAEKDITGSIDKAKKAIADLKSELPGFLPSGTFSKRESSALVEYSGLLCADLDSLGERLSGIKDILKQVPFVRAVALSPSGDGLKVFFNVVNDPARHVDSFRSIQENCRDSLGVEIDEKCKDPARICFFTYDPDVWVRTDGNEILPPLDPLPRTYHQPVISTTTSADMTLRERILALNLNCQPEFWPEKHSYKCPCPGEHLHTNKTLPSHCMVYLDGSPTIVCKHDSCNLIVRTFEQKLRSDIGKVEWEEARQRRPLHSRNGPTDPTEESKIWVEFLSPKQLIAYEPPEKLFMVGDCHIMLGATSVIGGPPSVGKSRALFQLAYCGATGADFMGMKVHRTFRTLILQNENGRYRLLQQYKLYDCDILEDFIRISPPPPFGMAFQKESFRDQMKRALDEFQPELFAVDPFNSIAYEQDSKEYLLAIDTLRSILPRGDDAPALLIAHHTRKPKTEDRASGRSLMHLLAGSYVLSSIPRCIWMMQQASNDVTETGIVWTCCKNNDGELGPRSAWDWNNESGLYEPLRNFNWDEFDLTEKDRRERICQSDVEAVLKGTPMKLSDAVNALATMTRAGKSSCYNALQPKGRFGNHLAKDKNGNIEWIP